MEIKTVSLTDIKPYDKNPRKNDRAVEAVMESIRQCGYCSPIVVDENGLILAGHTRYKALKKLGWNEAPVIFKDGMTEEQKRKYRLLDNKTNELAEWDLDLLTVELEGLDFEGFDFGFDIDAEIADFNSGPRVQEDNFDTTPPRTPKAKIGDIYQLGNHRLMCADSTDANAWAVLMNEEKADMVFTDPPYGVAIGDKNATLNSVQPSGRCTTNIANDTMSEQELYDMLKAAFINVRENCHDDAVYYVTSPQGGSLGLMMMMMMMMKDAGLPVRHVLMWMKNSATFSLGRLDYDYQHEPIFYTWTKSHHNYRGGENRTTVWQYDKPRKCDIHPTMKPVELVANAILDGTKCGDIVIDAFGGSGTTMIAAEQLGRKARLMELDPHYVDVIIARWENLTGKEAVLLNG